MIEARVARREARFLAAHAPAPRLSASGKIARPVPDAPHLATRPSHLELPGRQWIVLICLFLLSLPAVTPRIYSSDEIQYFAYLRSLWFDHDLSFENEYQYFYDRGIAKSDGFHETFLEMHTDTGRRLNFGTIGCAILWSPFYAAGDVIARTAGAPVDGFSKPYVAAVAYGSAVYGFLALVLALLSARRLGLNGFPAALAVWLGTPLLFYMYVAPPFSHACSAFGVALFTYVWLRVRDDWSTRGLIALGAAGALMAMVREQDAFFAAGPALDFGLWALGGLSQSPHSLKPQAKSLLVGAAAFAVVFSPQAATYLILNGHLGPHASVSHKMHWNAPHALQVLFSPEHGFFVWTPLALIAIAGLVWMVVLPPIPDLPPEGGSHESKVERLPGLLDRRIGACLLVMVALQIYVGGSVGSWTVAGAFGQRRFIALTTAMVIGLAWADFALRPPSRTATGMRFGAASAWARRACIGIVVLAVYWNLALVAEFSIGLMDRQRLEPAKNAYDAFVTLPRQAPSLVYRYWVDRPSFYKRVEGR
jgi:hypothetical protein